VRVCLCASVFGCLLRACGVLKRFHSVASSVYARSHALTTCVCARVCVCARARVCGVCVVCACRRIQSVDLGGAELDRLLGVAVQRAHLCECACVCERARACACVRACVRTNAVRSSSAVPSAAHSESSSARCPPSTCARACVRAGACKCAYARVRASVCTRGCVQVCVCARAPRRCWRTAPRAAPPVR
jgi:hypothetical protein